MTNEERKEFSALSSTRYADKCRRLHNGIHSGLLFPEFSKQMKEMGRKTGWRSPAFYCYLPAWKCDGLRYTQDKVCLDFFGFVHFRGPNFQPNG